MLTEENYNILDNLLIRAFNVNYYNPIHVSNITVILLLKTIYSSHEKVIKFIAI